MSSRPHEQEDGLTAFFLICWKADNKHHLLMFLVHQLPRGRSRLDLCRKVQRSTTRGEKEREGKEESIAIDYGCIQQSNSEANGLQEYEVVGVGGG